MNTTTTTTKPTPEKKPPRWLRLFKHRWLDESDSQRALPPDVLERIASRVTASEKRHSGEIRICVEAGLPASYIWQNLDARDHSLGNDVQGVFIRLRHHRVDGLLDHVAVGQADQVGLGQVLLDGQIFLR
ncbi:MAG: hypothetical protein ABI212_09435 [Burkholderiaceae bacterium]